MERRVKFALLLVFLVAAFIAVRYLGLVDYLDAERLESWMKGFGPLGPLAYIFFYAVGSVFLFPGLPMTVAGGILFGPFWGTLYVMAGASLGAALAFLVARYMGREWVEGAIKGGKVEELDRKVARMGWKIVAFTRLVPVFPFNFLNYAFGLTRIGFIQYFFATFFFIIPGTVAYVVFSSSLLDLVHGRVSLRFLAGLILVVLISILPFFLGRHRR